MPAGLSSISEFLTVVTNCSWECSWGTSRRRSFVLERGRAVASAERATKERIEVVFMIAVAESDQREYWAEKSKMINGRVLEIGPAKNNINEYARKEENANGFR